MSKLELTIETLEHELVTLKIPPLLKTDENEHNAKSSNEQYFTFKYDKEDYYLLDMVLKHAMLEH